MPYYSPSIHQKVSIPHSLPAGYFRVRPALQKSRQCEEETPYKPCSYILLPRGWALINHGLLSVSSRSMGKSRWENEETRQKDRDREMQREQKANIEENKEAWERDKESWIWPEWRKKTQRHKSVTTSLSFLTHVVCHLTRSVPCQPRTLPWLVNRQHTHLPSFANCQGKWDGRLISWRVCITLMQPRSSTALSQLHYWGKCLCGDQGLTMPSDACICVTLSPPDVAAICMVSAAQSDHFLPCHC